MSQINNRKSSKRICVVFAGQTQADNPAKVACDKLIEVFEELGLSARLWTLDISEEDIIEDIVQSAGLVLATTVEWYGIGYPLQRLLDSCYQKNREGMFAKIPLLSLVLSRTGYEREACQHLKTSWQILGGWADLEICGVFADAIAFQSDSSAMQAVEKKAEQFFRYYLNQEYQLPHSFVGTNHVSEKKSTVQDRPQGLSPEAKEQQERMRKEQENVMALSNKLKDKLEQKARISKQSLVEMMNESYRGKADEEYHFQVMLSDKPSESMVVLIKPSGIRAYLGREDCALTITTEEAVLRKILEQKISFQKAFMTGQLMAKGELNILYRLDELF